MQITVQEIANIVGGIVDGDPLVLISGPGKIEEAHTGHITFLSNPKYEQYIYSTNASAVLVSMDFVPDQPIKASLIKVENVYASLAVLLDKFNRNKQGFQGVSDHAYIDPSANIGKDVSIAAGVVIAERAVIGDRAVIFPHVYVGCNTQVGSDTILYPGVKVMNDCIIGSECIIQPNVVIGSDGFGFSPDTNRNYQKVPQIGNVIIEDRVEIGANTVIDRATMGSTFIREGAKLDNLIQVAHNVDIGKHTAIAAQTGISGSVKIGSHVLIGGQVGIAGHLSIADNNMIAAQTGIPSSIKTENGKYFGTPAMDYRSYLKSYSYFSKLPDIMERMRAIEKELDKLRIENP